MLNKCPACGREHVAPYPKMLTSTKWCYDEKYKLDPLIEGKERIGGQRVLKYTANKKDK